MTSAHSDRLGEVIAGFLQAVERGEAPDRKALLLRHPDLADELAGYFSDYDRMQKMAAPLHLPEPDATLPPLDPNATITQPSTSVDPLARIRYFGDYELINELARGGMGVVYKAKQVSLNRVIALKMILSGQLASDADVARFHAEAESAASLDHPNILPIYEVGEHQGQHYFAMKLVTGGSLAGAVPELMKHPKRAAAIVAKVSRAVHFAHQRGILHRDLKPANVLLDNDGTPYVTDFGLAKKVEGDSGLTQSGAIIGTPSYMAPEQARAEKQLTTGVDVYSLGAILYELVAGRPPFRATTVMDTLMQVLDRDPPDPRTLNPQADRDLCAIALKCLAKEPGQRYGSAAELADDLDRWRAGEPTKARPPSLAGLAARWLKRNAAAAVTVVAVGVLWGVAVSVALLAVEERGHDYQVFPRRVTSPFGWVGIAAEYPVIWSSLVTTAIGLTLVGGWVLIRGGRPRDPRGAIGLGAVTGLLAALTSFLFASPMAAHRLGGGSRLHPVNGYQHLDWDAAAQNPNHPDRSSLEYLRGFLPPHKHELGYPGWKNDMDMIRHQAVDANKLNDSYQAVWLTGLAALGVFLPLGVAGAWVVDYLDRSRGRRWANIVLYVELYVPIAIGVMVVVAFAAVFGISIVIEEKPAANIRPLVASGGAAVGGTLLAALAVTGVVRRWHPALRIVGYVICLGVTAAVLAGVLLPRDIAIPVHGGQSH